jgi:hypothetical protein
MARDENRRNVVAISSGLNSLGHKLRLSGIVIREPRPGWVTLEVPPLEEWREPLKSLTREERERVEWPDFYRTRQEHLTQK